jgi:hypothetical protein
LRYRSFVAGNLILDLANASESLVPARLELRCHQPDLGISSVILPECPIGRKARRLEISLKGVVNLIATVGYVAFCFSASSNGSRFNDAKQHLLDRIVDPQAAEGDAARLTVVEQATPAGIARNVMIVSSVADRQLPPAPLTTEKAGKKSVAM